MNYENIRKLAEFQKRQRNKKETKEPNESTDKPTFNARTSLGYADLLYKAFEDETERYNLDNDTEYTTEFIIKQEHYTIYSLIFVKQFKLNILYKTWVDKEKHVFDEDHVKIHTYALLEGFNNMCRARGSKPFTKYESFSSGVKLAVEHIKQQRIRDEFNKLKNSIIGLHGLQDFALLKQFVDLLNPNEPKDVVINRIGFWMACVKRYLAGLPVFDQILIMLYGCQHSGKTYTAKLLTEPLRDLTISLSVTNLADERYSSIINEHVIGVLDEMQGASRADITVIKNRITAEFITSRELYKSPKRLCPQTMYLGTTNESVDVMIKDSTGNRRFFQISSDSINFKEIAKMDMLKLWQSIPYENIEFYRDAPEYALMKVVQESQQYHESWQVWAEEHSIFNTDKTKMTQLVDNQRLYINYKEWCDKSGEAPLSNTWLFRRLRLKVKISFIQGKTVRQSYVSSTCPIL